MFQQPVTSSPVSAQQQEIYPNDDSDGESPNLDFRASLVSFPTPPSSLPLAGPSKIRSNRDRAGSVASSYQSESNLPHVRHRSRVSLDVTPIPGPSRSTTPSVCSRSSSIRYKRESSTFAAPITIPPRRQSRISIPAPPVNGLIDPRFKSAVTPDFEHLNPLERHIHMMATPSHRRNASLGARSVASTMSHVSDIPVQRTVPTSRPVSAMSNLKARSFSAEREETSPSYSDNEEEESEHEFPLRSPSSASFRMPSFTDATLRMTPGVVGVGEGWAGGPQLKKRSWFRRRERKSDDPLALWTVEEESPQRKSPLKNAWNRSMVAFGPGKEKESSSPKRNRDEKRIGPAAKMKAMLSRVDLREKDKEQAKGVESRNRQPKSDKWPTRLFTRSQNDLASFSSPRPPHSPGSPTRATETKRSMYAHRYAQSQPYLPNPRSTSLIIPEGLSSDVDIRREMDPEKRRKIPSRIIEEDEFPTPVPAPARVKRSATFGNGADDITTELGITNGDDLGSDTSSLFRPESAEPIDMGNKRRSMFGRPLVLGRLKSGFSSMRSFQKSPETPITASSRGHVNESGRGNSNGLHVSVEPLSTQSSSPASSSLRTPIPEAVTMMPLVDAKCPEPVKTKPTWVERSRQLSRSVMSLALPFENKSTSKHFKRQSLMPAREASPSSISKRPMGAKRASFHDLSLLKFSFGREDTFAGLFDIGRTPQRSEENLAGVAASAPIVTEPKEEVLADTLRALEGASRRGSAQTGYSEAMREEQKDEFSSIALPAQHETPRRPGLSPFARLGTPLSSSSMISKKSNHSNQGSLRTLRPDNGTPTGRRQMFSWSVEPLKDKNDDGDDDDGGGDGSPDEVTPTSSSSPPRSFAWASRPGLKRPNSMSSYHTAVGQLSPDLHLHAPGNGDGEERDRRVSELSVDSMVGNGTTDHDLIDENDKVEIQKARHFSGMIRQGSLIAVGDLVLGSGRSSLETA